VDGEISVFISFLVREYVHMFICSAVSFDGIVIGWLKREGRCNMQHATATSSIDFNSMMMTSSCHQNFLLICGSDLPIHSSLFFCNRGAGVSEFNDSLHQSQFQSVT